MIRDKAYFIMYSAEPNFYSDELQNVQNMIDHLPCSLAITHHNWTMSCFSILSANYFYY
jgi:hypothetical protein